MEQSPWMHLLMTLITVAGVGVIMWMEAPEWQRETIKRQIRLRARQCADRVARASGHRAMGRELDGTPERDAGYERTRWLSRVRDAL